MRKPISLLMCLCIFVNILSFSAITTFAASGTIFYEGFEASGSAKVPPGWAVEDVAGYYGDWKVTSAYLDEPDYPKAGRRMIEFNSMEAPKANSTRLYTVSNVASIRPNEEYRLSFWVYHNTSLPDSKDNIQLQIAKNGSSWDNVGQPIYRYDGSRGWKKHIVRLDPNKYSGDLKIAFLATGHGGKNMYLDEITVSNENVPVSGISLNRTAASITVGQHEQLIADVSPVDASNNKITWKVASQSSSNVATVSANGTVSANNPGTAVIRAESTGNPALYAEAAITVVPMEGTLFSDSFEDCSGQAPTGGWLVENVSGSLGVWNFVSSGTYPNPGAPQSSTKMAKFNSRDIVNSYPAFGNSTRLYRTSGINVTNSQTSLSFWVYHDTERPDKNDYIQVQVSKDGTNWINEGFPVNRNDGSTGWKNHTINLGKYKGTTDLRIGFLAMSLEGNNLYLDNISVTAPVVTVALDEYAGIMPGETAQMTAAVIPNNLPNQKVTWKVSSQNPYNTLSISDNGLITAKNKGTAVIRATSQEDVSAFAECVVTVYTERIPVTELGLNETSISIIEGQAQKLAAAIAPANATNKSVTWAVYSQSADNVATVSVNGLVTANSVGTAVIHAISKDDPSVFDECVVTVLPIPVASVSLDKTSASIVKGWTKQLTAAIAPANAANKSVTWAVYNQSTDNVATVSSNGLVTANNVGTAVIRATSDEDPGKYAECVVTVLDNAPLFTDSFEQLQDGFPAGWKTQKVNGTSGAWLSTTKGLYSFCAPKSGSRMIAFNSRIASYGHSARLIKNSGIRLGTSSNYELNFYMYHDRMFADFADNIQVQVSTDGGSTWVNVGDAINRYGAEAWKKHTISLNQYKGTADLRIAFLATSTFGNYIYLDDVSVIPVE